MIKVEKVWLRFILVVLVNSLVKGRITRGVPQVGGGKKINILSGMEGPVGSRDNVLKSIHHLEGARGLSADYPANHINIAFSAQMEDFEPLTHNPFREMFLCLRAEL